MNTRIISFFKDVELYELEFPYNSIITTPQNIHPINHEELQNIQPINHKEPKPKLEDESFIIESFF